jgi:hypothetical protein
MMGYVLVHTERFLIDSCASDVGPPIARLASSCSRHGVVGGTALILVPDGSSPTASACRYTKLHRVVGRIYVAGALFLAPMGAYVQWLDERLGVFPAALFHHRNGGPGLLADDHHRHRLWPSRSSA